MKPIIGRSEVGIQSRLQNEITQSKRAGVLKTQCDGTCCCSGLVMLVHGVVGQREENKEQRPLRWAAVSVAERKRARRFDPKDCQCMAKGLLRRPMIRYGVEMPQDSIRERGSVSACPE